MPAASALRNQIERALEQRFPAALTPTPRAIREVSATGVSEVDTLLDGGLPVGAISEVTGSASSGRTSLVLSFVAQQTKAESVCAWVDACDALDPESAAASGVILEHLLWVRCTKASRETAAQRWTRLGQALRATDLLLQVSGFGAIILDLGNVAPEHGNRIPLATWFRFRQAADRTRCCLVVLGMKAYAQSSAVVALECSPIRQEIAGNTVLSGFSYMTLRTRERFTHFSPGVRKPPASTWSACSSWERWKQI